MSAVTAPGAAAERRRTRRRLTVVGSLIVLALGFLVFKGLTTAVVFFKTTSEAVHQRASLGHSEFQLEGIVVKGSVHRVGPNEVAFSVTGGGAVIHVDNAGDPPQMFRPGLPVVLVGHFVGSGDRYVSDQIMVKHSQQYIAAHPNRLKVPTGSNS